MAAVGSGLGKAKRAWYAAYPPTLWALLGVFGRRGSSVTEDEIGIC